MRGGLTATEETFAPRLNFQDTGALETQKKMPVAKFVREKHWVKFPPTVDNETIDYTFGPERFEAKHSNKAAYVDHIRDQYARCASTSPRPSAAWRRAVVGAALPPPRASSRAAPLEPLLTAPAGPQAPRGRVDR